LPTHTAAAAIHVPGQKETGYNSWGKWITTTFAYVFSQLCSLKISGLKKTAPTGSCVDGLGFLCFRPVLFLLLYPGRSFGLPVLKRRIFSTISPGSWISWAVLIIIGAGWGLSAVSLSDRPLRADKLLKLYYSPFRLHHPSRFLFNQQPLSLWEKHRQDWGIPCCRRLAHG